MLYLRTDVDNFIAILNLTVSHYSTNDYNFIRKKRNDEKYFLQIKPYTDLIEELRTNKDKYNEKWTLERKSMEVDLDRAIEEEKKRSKN